VDFPTSSHRQGWIGTGLTLLLTAVCALAILKITQTSSPRQVFILGVAALISLIAACVVLYWTVTLLTGQYHIDRNGIRIQWGVSRLWVPMRAIQNVIPATELDDSTITNAATTGPIWLGNLSRRVRLQEGRGLFLRTTEALPRSLAVLTDDNTYFISPPQPDDFVNAWRTRRPLGSTQHWREREQRLWLPGLPIWRDALAWSLVGGAFITHLAVDAYLAFVYDSLPQALSFHFDAFGQPDRIGDRAEILRLPLIAFLLLAMDLALGFAVYRKHRIAAYLIWAGGLILQLLTWGALFTITG
jgi:hypothetical protein